MKKTIFSLACLLFMFCMTLHAQNPQLEYRPFTQEGKTWESQVGLIKENVYGNRIDGDTLINGENWKRVYNYIDSPHCNYSYYAAIRDDGKKVYAIARGSNRPRLLYDFSLKPGGCVGCGIQGNDFCCLLDTDERPDTLLGFQFVSYLRVERIDTIMARGLQHRRFTLTLLDAYKEPFRNGKDGVIGNVVWIESVGSGAGPFLPWMPLPASESILQSCVIGNNYIFAYPDFYQSDTPTSVGTVRTVTSGSIPFFNLLGRRFTGKPAKGVYIEDGKKRVVK